MLLSRKMFRTSAIAALVLAGVVSGARGQVPGGGSSFGGSSRGLVVITGSVLCAQCSLNDVRKAQPNESHLYQLSYRQNQLVMKMTAVNESAMFDALAWPPQLAVRGSDSVLTRLGAEENLFKEMTLIGLLHNSRTLDVFDITIKG
jgi:hypothetical protein